MLNAVKKFVHNFSSNKRLKREIEELKQKLQHRHTEINDLRYTKKILTKKIDEIRNVIEGNS